MKRNLLYFCLIVAAAVLLSDANHLYLFPAALVALALVDWRTYRIFLRWKLWLFFLLLVAIPVLLVGPRDARWLGIAYNSTMLRLNILMVERSIVLMLSIKMFTNRLSPETLSRGLTRLRLHQFDRVFRLSQDMLPELRTTVTASLREVNWRQIIRRPAAITPLLSRLVASIVFTARKSSMGEKQ
jgi:hypothetical protein